MTKPPTPGSSATGGADAADASDTAEVPSTADAPDGTVRTNAGTRLAYATYGDPDGTPLVFFHGTPGSRLLGRLLDDPAADAGVHVVAPDRPGYGRSELPSDHDLSAAGPLTSALADAVDAETVAVAGFSGGGAYALAAAATIPDRVRSVDLVAAAVPPSFVAEQPPVQRTLGWLARTTPTLLAAVFRAQDALARVRPGVVAAQYTAESSPVDVPEQVERLVAADYREALTDGIGGTAADLQFLSSGWGVPVETASRPARFWHGDADTNAPLDGARELAEALPRAEVTTFEGHGHLETLLSARRPVVEAVARRDS